MKFFITQNVKKRFIMNNKTMKELRNYLQEERN